jgi:hypothetical protein
MTELRVLYQNAAIVMNISIEGLGEVAGVEWFETSPS